MPAYLFYMSLLVGRVEREGAESWTRQESITGDVLNTGDGRHGDGAEVVIHGRQATSGREAFGGGGVVQPFNGRGDVMDTPRRRSKNRSNTQAIPQFLTEGLSSHHCLFYL